MYAGKAFIIAARMEERTRWWKWTGSAALLLGNAVLLGHMGLLGNPITSGPEARAVSSGAGSPSAGPAVAAPGALDALGAGGDTETTVVAELTHHVPHSELEDADDAVDSPGPAPATERRPGALADLVVLLSVDGLRPDAIFPGAPTMHRLGVEGARAVNSRTISKASTLPSHASMVSGVDVDLHGLSFNSYRPERGHIQYPTVFTGAQRAGLPTALFVGKRKLQHLLKPDTVAHFEVGGVFCSKVTQLAVPYLERAEKGLVFIHFSDPDSAGHRHGWMTPQYAKAVRRADRCVRQVANALRRRGKLERTALLVTSDHGGHDHNHGTRRADDREIPWLLWGGPARVGKKVRREVFNTDTAATVFHLLGIAPSAEIVGRPVLRALGTDGSDPAAPEAAR